MGNSPLLELKNPTETKDKCHAKSLANNLTTLTDKDLLALCQKYGKQAILWKRKFIGLLPEVDRRELYLKKRCSSVYEFSAKFGGVTNEQVKRVISIDKKLAELGLFELRSKLVNGEISLNKLARIISVANGENEKILIDAMKKLSQDSLETFVKDERNRQMTELLGSDGHENFFVGDLSGGAENPHLSNGKKSCENMFVRAHKQDYEINGVAARAVGGHGRSQPPFEKGLQRSSRQRLLHEPTITPRFFIAPMAYCEQLGVYLQNPPGKRALPHALWSGESMR